MENQSKWKEWGVFGILLFVCYGIYLNSIPGDFVFDDITLIKTEDRIEKLENIPRLLNPFSPSYLTYRPIRTISYAIDHYFFRKNPTGYHLSNIFYHALCCWLVFLLVRKLTQTFSTAAAASLLFALHPIHTEAVSYISGRRDVLSTLFYFLGFYWFLRYREKKDFKHLVGVFAAYAFGVLSKEMAVSLPAILFLFDWQSEIAERHRIQPATGRLSLLVSSLCTAFRRHLALYVPILAIGFFFVGYYLFITPSSTNLNVYWGGSPYLTLLTSLKILAKYIQLLFFPITLIVDYNSGQVFSLAGSLGEPVVFLSALGILLLLLLSLYQFAGSKWYGFCGLFFFITLLPVCHIIPHHELMSEHFLYLPSFAFCFFLALLWKEIPFFSCNPKWAYLALGILLSVYAVRTVIRNRDWQNEFTLWSATLRDAPESIRANTNLGLAHLYRNELDQAISYFRKSLQIPSKKELGTISRERAWQNLGIAYHRKKDLDHALECYREVIRLNPSNYVAYLNIGAVLTIRKNHPEAILHYQKALQIAPDSKEALLNLALGYAQANEHLAAIETFERLIRVDRGTDFSARAHFNIGMIYYYRLNDYQKASFHFENARRMNPEKYNTEKWLGKPMEVTRIETPEKK
jgi:protein O-mannosyl-transferase